MQLTRIICSSVQVPVATFGCGRRDMRAHTNPPVVGFFLSAHSIWLPVPGLQEGLELNPGFGISDVGLDVVMREHYSGTIPTWNAPHWTQPVPFEGKKQVR